MLHEYDSRETTQLYRLDVTPLYRDQSKTNAKGSKTEAEETKRPRPTKNEHENPKNNKVPKNGGDGGGGPGDDGRHRSHHHGGSANIPGQEYLSDSLSEGLTDYFNALNIIAESRYADAFADPKNKGDPKSSGDKGGGPGNDADHRNRHGSHRNHGGSGAVGAVGALPVDDQNLSYIQDAMDLLDLADQLTEYYEAIATISESEYAATFAGLTAVPYITSTIQSNITSTITSNITSTIQSNITSTITSNITSTIPSTATQSITILPTTTPQLPPTNNTTEIVVVDLRSFPVQLIRLT
ncbi:3783_t:CDS:2 [Racocetra fulgida]|uniref:3783_t:CDS:1 n=1 Tax=Racocetra fulgida TaxID=60492 RepID=A0A9N8WFT5_9GLOM|nr:3783_t:CDS:2 [Racocetra fulgida]